MSDEGKMYGKCVMCADAQLGQTSKTRQKLDLKKFVKLTGHTCACYSLTNFKYEAHVMTGNGTLLGKIREIT